MFAVGLIFIILAIIVVLYVIFATGGLDALSIDWGIFTASLTPLQLFFLGAVTVLVLAIGSLLLGLGLKTQGAKRAEVKRLRKEVKTKEREQAEQSSAGDTARSTPEPGSTREQGGADVSAGTADASATNTATGRRFPRRQPKEETPTRPQTYHSNDGSTSSNPPPHS